MKTKIILGIFGFLLVVGFLGKIGENHQSEVAGIQTVAVTPIPTHIPSPTEAPLPTLAPTVTPTPTIVYQVPSVQQTQSSINTSSGLSNNNYYTNTNGNQVHSPAYSNNGNVPAGATAQCSDGTYSFSQHRSGTCSHHGGVATWY